jgi:hypothetical protein
MPSAAVFSSTRATRLVPGIGAMSSPCASNQASATCADVAPTSAATASTSATMRRFCRKFSPVKRGLFLRQSPSARSSGERVLERYAPTVPGFFLYFPSVARRSAPLRLFVEAAKELAVRGPG